MGHDVEIIASLDTYDASGVGSVMSSGQESYINANGIKVSRLDYKHSGKMRKLRKYIGLRCALENSRPDLLFVHGCQFGDMDIVVNYLRDNSGIKVFVDNHADYSNSATNLISKMFLHRFYWRKQAQMIAPFVSRFWGVLPARVDFLVENYGIDRKQCGLLVMGGDDDEIKRLKLANTRDGIRERLGFKKDDFVIVTGGKIDPAKRQVLELMKAVKFDAREHVKLLVFGPISPQLKQEATELIDDIKIVHVGWANASESYDYFAAGDLAMFPGRHSVYWEQVVAMGIPMIVKRWDGTTHVDCGGNLLYTIGDSSDELHDSYSVVVDDADKLEEMKVAAKKCANRFLYSEIAARSIGEGFPNIE